MKEIPLVRVLQALTWHKLINIFKVSLSYYLSLACKKPLIWGRPFVLAIEPTNRCDLRCSQCDTGAGRSSRPRGDLSLAHFETILSQCQKNLLYLLLYDQGEPLLNPELAAMIHLAKEKNICVVLSTNGQRLAHEDKALEIVDSGLDAIILSADGLNETTYQLYRKGGRLKRVRQSLSLLKQSRALRGSRTPRLYLQFIVMRHNEHEVPDVHLKAAEWGADSALIKSVYVQEAEDARMLLPQNRRYRRYAIHNNKLVRLGKARTPCRRLWYSANVHWNGNLVPCCFDKGDAHILGNLLDYDLDKIWTGLEYHAFCTRTFHEISKPKICRNCSEGIRLYR